MALVNPNDDGNDHHDETKKIWHGHHHNNTTGSQIQLCIESINLFIQTTG